MNGIRRFFPALLLAAALLPLAVGSAHGAEPLPEGTPPAEEALPTETRDAAPGAGEGPAGDGTGEARPDTDADEALVYDEAGLCEWFEAHQSTGGSLRLGATVELTRAYTYSNGEVSFTIDTGPYGLVFNGGYLFHGDLTIAGEGVDVPVLEVRALDPFRMSWVHCIQPLQITASGRDGIGGTALLLSLEDNGWPANLELFTAQGKILSEGAGAVGIAVDGPLELYCFDVEVTGAGSAALRSGASTALWYSRLIAEGEGSAAVEGEVELYGCEASPGPERMHPIHIVGTAGSAYLPVEQGGSVPPWPNHLTACVVEDGGALRFETLPVYWDMDAFAKVDTGACGVTFVPGSVAPVFQGITAEEDALRLTVEVRDPALPCIREAAVLSGPDGAGGERLYAQLRFLGEYPPEELRLWRSDDEGGSWYPISHPDQVLWDPGSADYEFGMLEGTALLQLEWIGVGFSNVIALDSRGGLTWGGAGGDRTGVDRVPEPRPDPGGDPGDGVVPDRGDESPEDAGPSPSAPHGSDGEGFLLLIPILPAGQTTPPPAADTPPQAEPEIPAAPLGSPIPAETVPSPPPQEPVPTPAQPPAATPPREQETQPLEHPQPQEYENDDTIAVSGARLALMLAANPGGVPFVKQGVTVTVDADALAALGVLDHQLFCVTVTRRGEGAEASFTLDGAPVALAYTLVRPGGKTAEEEPEAIPAPLSKEAPAVTPAAEVREAEAHPELYAPALALVLLGAWSLFACVRKRP